MAKKVVKGEVVETITQARLIKERGWTRTLIEKFYPIPYELKKNPVVKTASPMMLYAMDEIKKIERRKLFKQSMEHINKTRESRVVASNKAAETKRNKTLAMIAELNIQVSVVKNVQDKAIRAYNDHAMSRDYIEEFASKDSDKSFLDRITVNYIRHELTTYDYGVHKLFSRVGKQEAFKLLNNRIFNEIIKNYPSYEEECLRQLAYKIDD